MTSLRICPHPSQEIVRLPPKTPKHVVDGSSLVLVHTGPYWSNHPLDVRSDLGQYHRSISFLWDVFRQNILYIYIYVRLYILLYNVLYLNGLRCQARAKRSFCFFFVRKFLEGLRAVVEGLPAFGEGLTVFHWFLFDADYTENVMKHGHLSSAWTQDRLSAPARNVKISNGL